MDSGFDSLTPLLMIQDRSDHELKVGEGMMRGICITANRPLPSASTIGHFHGNISFIMRNGIVNFLHSGGGANDASIGVSRV